MILIGFDNGELEFYNSFIQSMDLNFSLNKIDMINLEHVNSPVLSLEFSLNSEYLAVSYGYFLK